MACIYPRRAWYGAGRTKAGKNVVVFSAEKALFRNQPFQVSCGQCIQCRLEKARDWSSRVDAEMKDHFFASLVTLTYDDAHLPEHGSLVKDHPRVFLKLLRQELNRGRVARGLEPIFVRFLGCGEYGEKRGQRFGRPHYHIIVFGFAFQEDRRKCGKTVSGHPQYSSDLLDRLWGKGRARLSDVNAAVGEYVARYVLKKINGDRKLAHYQVVDTGSGEIVQLEQEFQFQSNQPGIGRRFVDNYRSDCADGLYVAKVNGDLRFRPLPKYFLRVLEKDDPELFEALKAEREAYGALHADDNTPERLDVKEAVAISRLSIKGRSVD